MGYGSQVQIQLRRDNVATPWGFRLQGGRDVNAPLSVQRVFNGSPSDGQLQRGDILLTVDNHDVSNMEQKQAQDIIRDTRLVINIGISRSGGSSDYDSYSSAATATAIPSYTHQANISSTHQVKSYGATLPQTSIVKLQQTWTPQQSTNTGSGNAQSYNHEGDSGYYGTLPPQSTHFNQSARPTQPSNSYYGNNNDSYNIQSTAAYDSPSYSQPRQTVTHTFTQGPPHQQHGREGGGGRGGGGEGGDGWGGGSSREQSYDQYSSPPRGAGGSGGSGGGGSGGAGGEEDDEGYEQKPVASIKQMFNQPDQTGGPRATSRVKRGAPRAPMWKSHEEATSSFSSQSFGSSTPIKSSLTPSSRPGAVQRGAPDNYPSSYIPVSPPDQGSSQIKRPGQYGYPVDTASPSYNGRGGGGGGGGGGGKGKYVGGFVGVSELTKPLPKPAAPAKKTPPGQKKKDFDPSQSSVLRVLQEEEERAKNNPRGGGPQEEEEEDEPRHRQQQQRGGGGGGGGGGQRQNTGQQWQQQRQQQPGGGAKGGPRKGGASLQALLERDQAQASQEDLRRPEQSLSPQDFSGGGQPTASSEYRRPGTNFKPAQVKSTLPSGNIDDYYPLPTTKQPDSYDTYPSATSYSSSVKYQPSQSGGSGGAGAGGYQQSTNRTPAASNYQPTSGYPGASSYPKGSGGAGYPGASSGSEYTGGSGYQSNSGYGAPAPPPSYSGSSKYPSNNYSSGGSGYYPTSDYGPEGIPACDF